MPLSALVYSIYLSQQDTEGVVRMVDKHMHGLEDGDRVTFREVNGMTQLNGGKTRCFYLQGGMSLFLTANAIVVI